jgi:hypothetical protein
VFAAPVWTVGLEADGEAGPAAVLDGVLDGLMTDCVMVLTPVTVLVTLPYDGGIPPPDGLTTGGAGGGDGAADEATTGELTGGAGGGDGAELEATALVTTTLDADDDGAGRGVAGFWI